ncbi:SOS response-associated peptidase [Thalassotalea aquiviva]|uniref:SOS response-associated peptidase n=1 Tax=Thalassotalea aquiviva TaxID=3242415 RepID=UPI003529E3A9
MCGRFSVNRHQVEQWVQTHLLTGFACDDNQDLCPSQPVSTLVLGDSGWQQQDTLWGIKPKWANKLIINAQSETVDTKATFKSAFNRRRCIVPFSAWYEWQSNMTKKQKYLFRPLHQRPLFMAGICYQAADGGLPLLVTLTTAPTVQCEQYHKRMPLLIDSEQLHQWFKVKNCTMLRQKQETFDIQLS